MRSAPAATAPSSAAGGRRRDRPRQPSSPRSRAVLTTAPTPVSTAQPNEAACSSATSRSTLTSERRDAVAYSAKAETPRMMMQQRLPARDPPGAGQERASRIGRGRRLTARGGAGARLAMAQLGTNTMTTWSPRARPSTSAPVSTTRCCRLADQHRHPRRLPSSITEKVGMAESGGRDLPRTSPGPGGASSTSSMISGRDLRRRRPAHLFQDRRTYLPCLPDSDAVAMRDLDDARAARQLRHQRVRLGPIAPGRDRHPLVQQVDWRLRVGDDFLQ